VKPPPRKCLTVSVALSAFSGAGASGSTIVMTNGPLPILTGLPGARRQNVGGFKVSTSKRSMSMKQSGQELKTYCSLEFVHLHAPEEWAAGATASQVEVVQGKRRQGLPLA